MKNTVTVQVEALFKRGSTGSKAKLVRIECQDGKIRDIWLPSSLIELECHETASVAEPAKCRISMPYWLARKKQII